jgi:hypothetical protein
MAKSDRPFWGIGTPVENSVLHEVDTPVVTSILSRSSNIFMACFRMMVRTFKLLGVRDPLEMMNWKSRTDVLAAMLILCL